MNINKILIFFICIFFVALTTLIGLLFSRSRDLSEQTLQENINASDQAIQDNPKAAVHGVRSPTPVPPNTLSITDASIFPAVLQATATVISVENTNDITYDIWFQSATNEPEKSEVRVAPNSKSQFDISPYKRDVTVFFVSQGATLDNLSPSDKVTIYIDR